MRIITPVRATLFAVVPFVFATIRLATTGDDARYLWLAVASTLGALAVVLLPLRGARATLTRFSVGVLVSAGCAAATALLLGARAGLGVAIVAAAFGLFSSAGCALFVRARDARRR